MLFFFTNQQLFNNRAYLKFSYKEKKFVYIEHLYGFRGHNILFDLDKSIYFFRRSFTYIKQCIFNDILLGMILQLDGLSSFLRKNFSSNSTTYCVFYDVSDKIRCAEDLLLRKKFFFEPFSLLTRHTIPMVFMFIGNNSINSILRWVSYLNIVSICILDEESYLDRIAFENQHVVFLSSNTYNFKIIYLEYIRILFNFSFTKSNLFRIDK